jgi:hypothetical protein
MVIAYVVLLPTSSNSSAGSLRIRSEAVAPALANPNQSPARPAQPGSSEAAPLRQCVARPRPTSSDPFRTQGWARRTDDKACSYDDP